MEKNKKLLKKHIQEAKRELDLFVDWYEKELNEDYYVNIITVLDVIMDELYRAQLKAIALDETMEQENE